MKKFKFLLIPKSNNFREIININEISYQLKNLGHNCFTLKSQISDDNLNFILDEETFDFVFRVNQGKPKNINKKVRFISWVRQISDLKESLDNFNEKDLIYTLKKTYNNHQYGGRIPQVHEQPRGSTGHFRCFICIVDDSSSNR